MAIERNVVDFKIHNLTEEQFQELKAQGKIDPNAVYCTPDTTKERLDALETKTDATNTALSQGLAQKQDIATAVNYDNITNCLTEIPQDINLELNNGTLVLKAGSKLHRAAGNLDETITITSDISATIGGNGQWMIILSATNNLYSAKVEGATSGPIANRPSSTTEVRALYFATDENKMYLTGNSGAAWYNGADYSLPICIVTTSNGAITNIDQVFNGFGYIGSTVFALTGVKGLIPKGRNEDGTLKNTEFTTGSVLTQTLTGGTFTRPVIFAAKTLGFNAGAIYDNKTNTVSTGNYMIVGTGSAVGGKITSFETKTAFHAVDYSDFEELDNSVLRKTGGTMSGAITCSDTLLAKRDVSDSQLELYGGTNEYNGGFLKLSGQDSPYTAFALGAAIDANPSAILVGSADGNLTWNQGIVATTKAKSLAQNGYVKFNNGLIIQWGRIAAETASSTGSVTFPTPFTSANASVQIEIMSIGNGKHVRATSITTTGFTYETDRFGDPNPTAEKTWMAIGY